MTQVFASQVLPSEEFSLVSRQFMLLLPDYARDRVLRNKQPLDRQRSLLGEIMIRAVIRKFKELPPDQIELGITEKGKSFLRGMHDFHFNLSHSGKWVVVAVSVHEVGVDIEKIEKARFEVAKRFFSRDEYQQLQSLHGEVKNFQFYSLWTVKESYLKYLGKGLTQALSSFSVRNNHGKMELEQSSDLMSKVYFHQYQLPENHLVSVCSPEDHFSREIQIISHSDLFNMLQNGK
ncbi:MAG: 4'-phosphopantetheinyl transferase family protein [Bacteroidales bacterium]